MSKNNVHPDHYKVDGRDRQDDAAAARFARAVAAKAASRERPDRLTKGPYFQRPEPAAPASTGRPGERAQKESSSRTRTAKKSGTRKASAPRRAASPKAASNRASKSSRGKKSGIAAARPTKKR
jgi:hypothetical protein